MKQETDKYDPSQDVDVRMFMTSLKYIFLIIAVILTFCVIDSMVSFVGAVSANDIDYDFTNNNFYNSSSLVYDESFNIRENPNGLSEVDKWEFALEEPDVLNPIGADDPNGWSDWETSDTVNIQSDSTNDRVIYMYSASEDFGIERTNFNGINFRQNDDNINVSINFRYTLTPTSTEVKTNLYIRSSDNTLIAQVRWYYRSFPTYIYKLEYFNGASYIELQDNIHWAIGTSFIEYNIGINYTSELVDLRFNNATDNFNYQFSTIASGKDGMKAIEFKNTDGDGDTFPYISCGIRVDSIGLYSNGYSQTDEHAWKSIQLPTNWNIEHHNLFTTKFSGWGMLNYTDGIYEVGSTTLEDMREYQWYYNVEERINIYHTYVGVLSDPYLILYQVNQFFDYVWWFAQTFDVSELSIDGVSLVEPTRTSFLVYSYSIGHTDPEDNYFYVGDNTNDLYFTLTCQDSSVEYIQADFDIANKLSNDFALKFEVDITAGIHDLYGAGAFYLNFDGATSWGYTFNGIDKFNQIIPQGKTVLTMTILITDNDEDWQSGTTITGYITNFQFLYFANIGTSLLISDMLTMLVPLIVLIAPTLGFYKKFGKRVVAPVLMLMSIVCVATDLIPYWVFFVMLFSFIIFMFFSYKSDRGSFV